MIARNPGVQHGDTSLSAWVSAVLLLAWLAVLAYAAWKVRLGPVGQLALLLLALAGIAVVLLAGRSRRDRAALGRAIAEQRALAASLKVQAAQLAGTVRELDAFSYSVSHDLRAPLRHINGYAQMLEEDAGESLDQEARRQLAAIRNSTRRMAGLIDDLLMLSRLGRKPLERETVDMRALVDSALASVDGGAATIQVGELPPAHADAALLRQVWVALLSNAVKFSAPRGADAHIGIAGHTDAEGVDYSVVDNGVGFDTRYADKLFGVFQRLHGTEFEGTGSGLAIVQRIVTRHGGTVHAHGSPGEGASFGFRLPHASIEGIGE